MVTNQLISQHITVGETTCNFHLLNASFQYTLGASPPSGNVSGNYSIDLENDGSDDIQFYGANNSYSSHIFSVSNVTSLGSVKFASGNNVVSTTGPPGCPYTLMKNMSVGDGIDESLIWSSVNYPSAPPDTAGFLDWHNNGGSGTAVNCSISSPVYLAFRKVIPNDTIYGWIYLSNIYTVTSYAFKYASDNLPPVFSTITSATDTICKFDSVVLAGIPSGGTFAGQYVSNNSFQPEATGNFTVNYLLNNGSNCVTNSTLGIHVDECVGLKELVNQDIKCKIYPNPTTGNFVIKGMLNEPITICNELGQIVEIVELKKENGYEAKLYDYDSGIYFIGNKLYKQKLVVIH